jgi:RNA polymerase sigma-70 factor (ECF subfamily)
MGERGWLTERFEADRPRLRTIASRMLGSPTEADDAVQEAWLRLSRSQAAGVENLSGWLTTVVARVCLDMLRSRHSRLEDPLGVDITATGAEHQDSPSPEHEVMLADSVGLALLLVLDTLAPAERVAFVLHDMFDVSFNEIGPIVDRSPAATRQLASRARRRIRGASAQQKSDEARQRELVGAFFAASRGGDFDSLLTLLDPDVKLRPDSAAVAAGAKEGVRGAAAVAEAFAGRARAARLALIDGAPGAVWAPGGRPRVVFMFTLHRDMITAIDMIADPGRLREFDLVVGDWSVRYRCDCVGAGRGDRGRTVGHGVRGQWRKAGPGAGEVLAISGLG